MNKRKILLLAIFLLAGILRFYRLGEVPKGFHRDEAFLGYNAYSVLRTGRDINGKFLPLHLESFIYSPAGYSYFTIPSIALFGLNEFAVRFPSAFLGSLTVLITYFLVQELFVVSQLAGTKKAEQARPLQISLLASFMLAISPWHINLSRTATENVIVVFFITLGVLLYLEWLKRPNLKYLTLSFGFFGITLLIYQASRAFLPLFIPLLIYFFRPQKKAHAGILYLLIILLPLVLILFSPNLALRIRTVSIFTSEQTQLTLDEQLREDGVMGIPSLSARLFHNKLINYGFTVAKNYFSHFTYDFLFTDSGLPDRYRVPSHGLLYIFELPLVFLGIWTLLQKQRKIAPFLLGWIFLAPIGSALAFDDVPNLQRTLLFFPAISIITAVGLTEVIKIIKKKHIYRGVYIFIGVIIIYSHAFYLHQYYIHQVVHRPWFRHEGYKELVSKVNELLPNYKKAIITNRESAPTIFFLFYGKYDPATFQAETKNSQLRDFDRVNFSQYKFSLEECPLRKLEKDHTGRENVLYVNYTTCDKLPEEADEIAQIKRSDNTVIFRILDVRGSRKKS